MEEILHRFEYGDLRPQGDQYQRPRASRRRPAPTRSDREAMRETGSQRLDKPAPRARGDADSKKAAAKKTAPRKTAPRRAALKKAAAKKTPKARAAARKPRSGAKGAVDPKPGAATKPRRSEPKSTGAVGEAA